MEKVILAYIPVLHQGYWQLFSDHPEAKKLYILSDQIAQQFTPVHKEIRALPTDLIAKAITSWNRFDEVSVADEKVLQQLNEKKLEVIIPQELVTTEVATRYLPDCKITLSSIFLRWDKAHATQSIPPNPTAIISDADFDVKMSTLATQEGQKSSDWWRYVGAVAVKDGKVIAQAHNTHLPSEQQPYAEGDPRAHFHKGDHIELTTAIHAEAKLIAEAAARGTALAVAELYVTDFPCPVCAKSIAFAGIKKVFFQKGYAMLDGERVLQSAGVEIIQIK